MKNEDIEFLEDYKSICIKHKKQILGFDDGAFISDLTEDALNLEALVFNETHYGDGSVGQSNIHFATQDELKNSISGIKTFRQSTRSKKEDLEDIKKLL